MKIKVKSGMSEIEVEVQGSDPEAQTKVLNYYSEHLKGIVKSCTEKVIELEREAKNQKTETK